MFLSLRDIAFDESAPIDPYWSFGKVKRHVFFCSSVKVFESDKILWLFPIKFNGGVKDWLEAMLSKTINTWVELDKFFYQDFTL